MQLFSQVILSAMLSVKFSISFLGTLTILVDGGGGNEFFVDTTSACILWKCWCSKHNCDRSNDAVQSTAVSRFCTKLLNSSSHVLSTFPSFLTTVFLYMKIALMNHSNENETIPLLLVWCYALWIRISLSEFSKYVIYIAYCCLHYSKLSS